MTTTDPIRAAAALTDPDLRAQLQSRLDVLQAAAAAGGLRERNALQVARDTWSVLAAYPWQPYDYRYGRWQADLILWRALITFQTWESFAWRPEYDSFQLIDPHTGARTGEFYSRAYLKRRSSVPGDQPDVVAEPGGTLEFAGDPGSVGVYRTPGGGVETLRFSWTPYLILGTLRGGIELLRSGQVDRLPPARPRIDLDLIDGARVWFSESRDKPSRKPEWKAAYAAFHYRPGQMPRFGRTKQQEQR